MYYFVPDNGDVLKCHCLFRQFDVVLDHWIHISPHVGIPHLFSQHLNILVLYYISRLTLFRYNMVGHCKFCLLLIGGAIMFEESLALNQAIGITLTLGGIILYAHVKVN